MTIVGIQPTSFHHKLSLYALTCASVRTIASHFVTFSTTVQVFHRFREFNNFKLNMSKTKALNISLSANTLAQLCSNFSFQWSTKVISYLGITISSSLSGLYTLNYVLLLARIRKDLDSWNSSLLPWFRHINTLKMDTFPKLLYLFQMVSITVPKHFFTSLSSLLIRFVWNRGLPRIFVINYSPIQTSGRRRPTRLWTLS